MKMKKISKEQSELIEEIGRVIEERADLSPLASRIYATLILASDDGLTFEDIIEAHQASKGSVSNNINVLVKLDYVSYYTKPGQRKRFFKASKLYVKTAMEKYQELFEKEINVVDKINKFNKKNNPDKFKDEESVEILYQKYLSELKDGFERKMIQFKKLQGQA